MQKHLGICFFLVTAEFKHNIGGYATLRIHINLAPTLPLSDKQGSFFNLLGKALVIPLLICKECHELGLVQMIGKKRFSRLTGQLTGPMFPASRPQCSLLRYVGSGLLQSLSSLLLLA